MNWVWSTSPAWCLIWIMAWTSARGLAWKGATPLLDLRWVLGKLASWLFKVTATPQEDEPILLIPFFFSLGFSRFLTIILITLLLPKSWLQTSQSHPPPPLRFFLSLQSWHKATTTYVLAWNSPRIHWISFFLFRTLSLLRLSNPVPKTEALPLPFPARVPRWPLQTFYFLIKCSTKTSDAFDMVLILW